MILIHKTFEVFEQHDEEDDVCEPDESGFDVEDEPVTFRELVDMLRGGQSSCGPAQGETWEWVTHYGEMDYIDGSFRNESVHFSRSNPARREKYWRLAFKAAGLAR